MDKRIDDLDDIFAKQTNVQKLQASMTPLANYNALVKRVDKCAQQDKMNSLISASEKKLSSLQKQVNVDFATKDQMNKALKELSHNF